MMLVGSSGNTTNESICKNCGNEIVEWTPDYYCAVHETDQPLWLHSHYKSGNGVWCQIAVAEPLDLIP